MSKLQSVREIQDQAKKKKEEEQSTKSGATPVVLKAVVDNGSASQKSHQVETKKDSNDKDESQTTSDRSQISSISGNDTKTASAETVNDNFPSSNIRQGLAGPPGNAETPLAKQIPVGEIKSGNALVRSTNYSNYDPKEIPKMEMSSDNVLGHLMRLVKDTARSDDEVKYLGTLLLTAHSQMMTEGNSSGLPTHIPKRTGKNEKVELGRPEQPDRLPMSSQVHSGDIQVVGSQNTLTKIDGQRTVHYRDAGFVNQISAMMPSTFRETLPQDWLDCYSTVKDFTSIPIFSAVRNLIGYTSVKRQVVNNAQKLLSPVATDALFQKAKDLCEPGTYEVKMKLESNGYSTPVSQDDLGILKSFGAPFIQLEKNAFSIDDYEDDIGAWQRELENVITLGKQAFGIYQGLDVVTYTRSGQSNPAILSSAERNIVKQEIANPLYGYDVSLCSGIRKWAAGRISDKHFVPLGLMHMLSSHNNVKTADAYMVETDQLTSWFANQSYNYIKNHKLSFRELMAMMYAVMPPRTLLTSTQSFDEDRTYLLRPHDNICQQILLNCAFLDGPQKEMFSMHYNYFRNFGIMKESNYEQILEQLSSAGNASEFLNELATMMRYQLESGEIAMFAEMTGWRPRFKMQPKMTSETQTNGPWILLCSLLFFVTYPKIAKDVAHVLIANIWICLDMLYTDQCAAFIRSHGYTNEVRGAEFISITDEEYLSGRVIPTMLTLNPDRVQQQNIKLVMEYIQPLAREYQENRARDAAFPRVDKSYMRYISWPKTQNRYMHGQLSSRVKLIHQFVAKFTGELLRATRANQIAKPTIAVMNAMRTHLEYGARLLSHEVSAVAEVLANYPLQLFDLYTPSFTDGPTVEFCVTSSDKKDETLYLSMAEHEMHEIDLGVVLFPYLRVDSVYEKRALTTQPTTATGAVYVGIQHGDEVLNDYFSTAAKSEKFCEAIVLTSLAYDSKQIQGFQSLTQFMNRFSFLKVRMIANVFNRILQLLELEPQKYAIREDVSGNALFQDMRFKNWILSVMRKGGAPIKNGQYETPTSIIGKPLDGSDPLSMSFYNEASRFITSKSSPVYRYSKGIRIVYQAVSYRHPKLIPDFVPDYVIEYEPNHTFVSITTYGRSKVWALNINGEKFLEPSDAPKVKLVINPVHGWPLIEREIAGWVKRWIMAGKMMVELPELVYLPHVEISDNDYASVEDTLIDNLLLLPAGPRPTITFVNSMYKSHDLYSATAVSPCQIIFMMNPADVDKGVLYRNIFENLPQQSNKDFEPPANELTDGGPWVENIAPLYSDNTPKRLRVNQISIMNPIPVFSSSAVTDLPKFDCSMVADWTSA